MNGTVNKVILIGNLGKAPEVRHFENGSILATFPLATSETFLDKQTGERREVTDWHDVVLWRGLAETAEKYLTKGSKVYLEGKIKKRSYQDKEGQTRYATEIVADEMTLLSRNESDPKKPPYGGDAPMPNSTSPNQPSAPDDDLPF
jgi:single-strand DNA-binding protein